MADTLRIVRAHHEPAVVEALANILLDCVEGGASVGFMHPLSRTKAIAFWENVLTSADRGERIVLIATDGNTDAILGTVQSIISRVVSK